MQHRRKDQTKEEYNEYMKTYMLKRYNERLSEAKIYLGGKCTKCTETENLDFDHIIPSTKKFTIGVLWSINKEDFWKEIEKCQLLCKPCHNKKTIVDKGQVSARGTHGTISSVRYCSCDLCKAAKNKYNKERREKLGLNTVNRIKGSGTYYPDKISEIVKLKNKNLSHSKIALIVGDISKSAVGRILLKIEKGIIKLNNVPLAQLNRAVPS